MRFNELVNSILFRVTGLDKLRGANDAIDDLENRSDRAADALARTDRRMERFAARNDQARTAVRRFARGGLGFLGGALRAVLSPIGLLIGGGGISAIGAAAIRTASDVQESRDKMRDVLGDQTQDTERWVRQNSRLYGSSRNDFRNFVTDFSLQFQKVTDDESATDIARELTKRAVDLASFSNKNTADVVADFTSAINGSSETVEKYSIGLKDAEVSTFILSNGIRNSRKEITEADKRLARYQLILQDTDDATDNFIRTNEGFAGTQKLIQGTLRDIAADVGAKFLPVVTRAFRSIFDGLEENEQKIIDFFSDAAESADRFVANGGLTEIADGLSTIGKAAVSASRAILFLLDLVTTTNREQNDLLVRNEAFAVRNERLRNTSFADRTRGALFGGNPLNAVSDADRATAEARLRARGVLSPVVARPNFNQGFSNSNTSTNILNQNIRVEANNNGEVGVERAVRRGANSGVSSWARASGASGVRS